MANADWTHVNFALFTFTFSITFYFHFLNNFLLSLSLRFGHFLSLSFERPHDKMYLIEGIGHFPHSFQYTKIIRDKIKFVHPCNMPRTSW